MSQDDLETKKKLMDLIKTAYNKVQDPKFSNFRVQLLEFYKELDNDADYIKVMLGLRTAILQADLSLKLKERVSGLPTEYGDIFHFIDPQLRKVDNKVLDKYTRYGFVPLEYGSTVKYF